MRRLLLPLVLAVAIPLLAVPAPAVTARDSAVVSRRVLGQSAQGRDIVAYHLGEPGRPGVDTVVLLATMHGDERDTREILRALVQGPEVIGLDVWVVPTYNPDGYARRSRQNGRGVDLNRNFPQDWAPLDGRYESGSRPASEPETRAMMAFLRRIDPDWILSFHQPLNGVDTDSKDPAFARRVARTLRLPTTRLDCGGACHGTLTSWFNARFDGVALTVEYDASPSRRRMRVVAPDQVLRVFGAVRGYVGAEPLDLPVPPEEEPDPEPQPTATPTTEPGP